MEINFFLVRCALHAIEPTQSLERRRVDGLGPTCDLHAGSEVKTQGSSSLGQVIIKHNSTTVIAVKQRDLFSKYRWPAAPKILERLEMLKEDLED